MSGRHGYFVKAHNLTTGAFAIALATTHSYSGVGAINKSDSIEPKNIAR
ncbi:MAG: hypothetical protein IPG99_20080 [Ignavibacteria bacterium]|nr:hypothetical protein [Ignavibacteria bacterium]